MIGRQHGFAGDGGLPLGDQRPCAFREINVDARAEADHADARPGGDDVALAHERDDAPRDQTRDLHHGEAGAAGGRDDEGIALVLFARLVEIGADEGAGLLFTWQSNTLMKIDTRVSGFSPSPSSGAGTILAMRLTRPSAGATTMPSRTGVVRGGSRKK
jgi:hypothetical protein